MVSARVWLVTGCSSGIGEHIVRQILARGDRVVATARRVESLAALAEAGAAVLPLDVTADLQAVKKTVADAIAIYGRIDILVNNAGYAAVGTWEDLGNDGFHAQFECNVFGVLKVTQALLPHLRERRSGTVVFIGSRAGWVADAAAGAYCGSKFALAGMVESLQGEVKHLGIKTLLIEPGKFRTRVLTPGNMKAAAETAGDYAPVVNELKAQMALLDQTQQGDPAKLARIVLDLVRCEGVAAGKKEIPLRFPVGVDVFADVKARCKETLAMLEEWEGVMTSTDYDEVKK